MHRMIAVLLAFGFAGFAHADWKPPRFCPKMNEEMVKNAPVVKSIEPFSGHHRGGTFVNIEGRRFRSGAAVRIGDSLCTGVAVLDSQRITCTTSSHELGTVGVTVVNPDGLCGELPDAFQYGQSLYIYPTSKILAVGNEVRFVASRGQKPYTFSILEGEGKVDPVSGLFHAPAQPGLTVVRATDSLGSTSDALVITNPALVITPTEAVIMQSGKPATFASSGGVPPYRYFVADGPGEINEFGDVKSSEAGTTHISVQDSVGNSAQATVTIHPEITIYPKHRKIAVGNIVDYTAKGGVPPLTFSISAGPGGIDPTSGRYRAQDTPGQATIRITDSQGNYDQANVLVMPGILIYPPKKNMLVGDSMSFATIGGLGPVKFSLNGKGQIDPQTGFYTAPEDTAQEHIRVTDALGNFAESEISVEWGNIAAHPISTASGHSCAVADGGVKCWGENHLGELGTGGYEQHILDPKRVLGIRRGAISVVSGMEHTCALIYGGVKCWGNNDHGQLGNNTRITSHEPVQVVGLTFGVTAIAAGQFHTCAVRGGGVLCWGDNRHGQLGTGNFEPSSVPLQVKWITKGAQSISAGAFHTCALVDGKARCWGYNSSGQLGDGITATKVKPVEVQNLPSPVTAVEAQGFHSCAIAASKLYCWGFNANGQLGNGSTKNSFLPIEVSDVPGEPTMLALGRAHTCVLASGKVWCWGANSKGQLGDGTTQAQTRPVRVHELLADEVKALSLGFQHTCALVKEGVRCWGDNSLGQFGTGTTRDSLEPQVAVPMK